MVLPPIFLYLYVALAGLIVGSYLNVVIYRLPRGLSTVLPRSRCPVCNAKIRPWHNVPLLSYLWLGGRCGSCRTRISWRYPLVEALTGAAFLACLMRFGVSLEGLVAAGFCAAMIVLAMIDSEHYILPNVITLPGIAAGLVLQPWLSWATLPEALVGALLGAGLLLLIAILWLWLRGVQAMGMGDVKMLAMVGAFLGWQGVMVTLFLGSLFGSLVGVGLMLRGRLEMQSKLPFGTFLGAGAILALFWGKALLYSYLGPI